MHHKNAMVRPASGHPVVDGLPRGQLVAVVVLALLAILLTAAARGGETLPGDVLLARWVQSAPELIGKGIGWLGYWIGSAPIVVGFGAILAGALWWRGETRLAAFTVALLLLRALNPLLKLAIASPRPDAEAVVVSELADGYGFPSGHVMGAVLIYGGVIWIAQRAIHRPVVRHIIQTIAVMLIFITGIGRVVTGAHWPSDVLGGVLWGTVALLTLTIIAERWTWPQRLDTKRPTRTSRPIF